MPLNMKRFFERPPSFDMDNGSSPKMLEKAPDVGEAYSVASGETPQPDADGYVPPPRSAGFIRTLANVVCMIIGTGALQIPYVFSKIGWVGLVIIGISAFIGMYSGTITVRCLYYREGKRLHTFTDIGYHAFGPFGQYFTQFFNYLFSVGTSCLFVILSGTFLDELFNSIDVDLGHRVWMVIVTAVVLIPILLLKHMSEVAILSIFGFLSSLVMIAVAIVQSFRFPYTKMYPDRPAPEHKAGIGSGVPAALSSIVFSFSGTIIYPHVEACMRKPKQWPMVMACSMTICVVLYSLVGIAGYWAYGDQAVSPILHSLPDDGANKAAKVLVTLHVMLATPLLIMSFFLEIEERWHINADKLGKKKELIVRSILRTAVMVAVCGISVGIPYFDNVLSLIGALSVTVMFTVVPVCCYIKLYGYKNIPWYQLVWCFVIFCIGWVGCVWGSIDAIRALIKDVKG